MNASAEPERDHLAYICLGSNISPVENMRKAVAMLRDHGPLLKLSSCWQTEAFSSPTTISSTQPNFINAGALLATPLSLPAFKQEILGPIEAKLGRVRTADKYAPRTIDLDITIFDGQVLDADLWKRVYLALIFAELAPDLHNPQTRETLHETASRLAKQQHALQRLDITLE